MQITRSYQSPSPDNMKYESSQYRTAVPAQTTYPSSSLPSPPHHWDYQPAQQNYIPSTQAPLSPAASDPDMNQVWISSESDLHINIHTSGSEAPVYYRQQDLYNTAQYPSPSQSSFKSRATSLVSTYSTSQTSMDRTPIRKATTSPTQKKKKTTSESGGKVYCDICQKGFGRRWNLTSHKKNTHEPNQVRPFPCTGFMESGEPCTRAFKRKTDCTRHFESVHAKLKPWPCRMCKHTFSRKDTLTRHEKDGCGKRTHIPSKDGTRQIGKSLLSSGYQYPTQHNISTDPLEMHLSYQQPELSSSTPPPPYAPAAASSYTMRIAQTYPAAHYRPHISSGLPPLADVVPVSRQVWH